MKTTFASITMLSMLLGASFAGAQTTDTTNTATTTSVTTTTTTSDDNRGKGEDENKKRQNVTFDPICPQNAIEKRDTAVIAALDTYHASMKTALTTRKDAVKAAWSKTTVKERNESRRAANEAFKTASRGAHNTLKTARTTSWNTYKTEMKACGLGAGIDQPGQVMGGLMF